MVQHLKRHPSVACKSAPLSGSISGLLIAYANEDKSNIWAGDREYDFAAWLLDWSKMECMYAYNRILWYISNSYQCNNVLTILDYDRGHCTV